MGMFMIYLHTKFHMPSSKMCIGYRCQVEAKENVCIASIASIASIAPT
jgi:hypothetical protein